MYAFRSLLEARALGEPDARPLYAYRFSRSEYEHVATILRRHGPRAIDNSFGAALLVSHIAEWFRRERGGGHWDWIRPLRSIGYEYGTHASVRYQDVENFVATGLRVWRRPMPHGGERLLSVVREAGFPVASVREDPRISSWLKNSILCAERGFSIRDAVGAEAWRVSDRLAQALFEPASELCEKIAELRASLPSIEVRGDPVDFLDQSNPRWREELPFEVEGDDVRSMVEEIVRAREDGSAALDITRHLVRSGEDWIARASLGLSGRVDLRRLPPSIAGSIRQGRRVRVVPRPPYCEELAAVAAIETYKKDDVHVHELRAFVATFDAPLALEEEARLAVQAGSTTIGDFVATGGEALHAPVVALQIEQHDERERPVSLRVLGTSPVRTTRPALALAVREEHFHALSFSQGYSDLGLCKRSNRRIVNFSGTAQLTLDGARWTWRTMADRDADARLVLVGDLLRNVRESVFLGLPQVWIERDGHLSAPRRHTLHSRPRGRGRWHPIDSGKPWGDIDLAVIENGELQYLVAASIVPNAFQIAFERGRRQLRISGLEAGLLAARASTNLEVRFEGADAVVVLGPPSSKPLIEVRPRWDAELALTMTDPSSDLRLIDADDALVKSRSTLSIDGLKGLRILAMRPTSLCMELQARDTPRLMVARSISGEVPLSAFTDVMTQLLGSSQSLDARIVLSATGATENIAEVRWYAEDVDPFTPPVPGAFSRLETNHRLDLRCIAICHPAAGAATVTGPASQAEMSAELSEKLSAGPWLIYGRRSSGARIRPRIVPAVDGAPTGEETLLERAIRTDSTSARATAFAEAYSNSDQVLPRDRRTLIELLVLARREGLPISSIDALKVLDRSPRVASLLLAFCESLEERAALLDLQRDLPFIWASTTIEGWLGAFSARIEDVRSRLAEIGIGADVIYRNVLSALSEIVGLRPELAGHAKAVFLMLVATEMTREGKAIDGAAVHFLQIRRNASKRSEIDRMRSRHDDVDPPPQQLLGPRILAAHRSYSDPYDSIFEHVITAPFAIVDHASGRRTLDETELRRCRDAWLYDPEYFEAIVPMGIDEVLCGFAGSGEGRR
ncbi:MULTISPECIES: STY4851/ECs_5259 family protein [unclassified Ensifer]|uniref:STY4851/ECs_5259 family protein n=1 Tax=unclassified Ensifer TaxID=2633371 RepID=UPI00300FEEF0